MTQNVWLYYIVNTPLEVWRDGKVEFGGNSLPKVHLTNLGYSGSLGLERCAQPEFRRLSSCQ